LRLISGKYGGRILRLPANLRARPTTDKAREGLFNILSNNYEMAGIHVLDLFAGTGSIGFEFISRGAAAADLVEINVHHVKFLHRAKAELKADEVTVIRSDAFRFIQKSGQSYHLVFADPPYDLKSFTEVLPAVMNSTLLKKNGIFILEHPSAFSFSERSDFLEHRRYGSVNFSIFSKQKE
jgi:16S rRNA (guanine(966)-N(2))-methyltransferase RsmD